MAEVAKREPKTSDMFDRFDRMFDDWARMLPFRRAGLLSRSLMPEDMIRVEERRDKDALVIRAELPGVDPEKDVELTVTDGMLNIEAERHEEEKKEGAGYTRRELRYGSFTRSLPLPAGVSGGDVNATYKDGILEIRIPTPEPKPERKIAISKA